MSRALNYAISLGERGLLPDAILRRSIRYLVRQRLGELRLREPEQLARRTGEFVAMMDAAPIAPVPEKANEQHYEVPAALFKLVLGKHMKYSCGYWRTGTDGLDAAEVESLRLTAEHAALEDGMTILELGCGWGSLTLWLAAHYPNSRITAVSNSRSQREHISAEADRRGLSNIRIITADMNEFRLEQSFDRVVSVEMFEHMRNYRRLFSRIAALLNARGRFLMHIFCHRAAPYEFIARDESDWMSRYFFSGGIMPADELPLLFQDELLLQQRWRWAGTHYARTANAWLCNMDAARGPVMAVLGQTYGAPNAGRWWMRWRLFFMACAELFGHDHGREWWVSHYLFRKRP